MANKHWLKDGNDDALSMITAHTKSANRQSGRLSDFVRPAGGAQVNVSNGRIGANASTNAPKRPSLDDDRRGSRKGGMPPSSAFAKSAAGMMGLGGSGGTATNGNTTTTTNGSSTNKSGTSVSSGIGSVTGGKVRFGDDIDEKKEDYDYDAHAPTKSRVPSNKRASGHIGTLALNGGLAGNGGGRTSMTSTHIGATPQPGRTSATAAANAMPNGEKKGGGAVSRFSGSANTTTAPSDSLTALMSKPKDGTTTTSTTASTSNRMKESTSTKSLGRTSNGMMHTNNDRVTPSPQPTSGGTYQLPSSLLNLSSSSAFSPRTSSSFASAALSSLSPFAPSATSGSSFSAATSPTHHNAHHPSSSSASSFTTNSHHHAMAGPVVSTRPRPNVSVSAPQSHVTSPTGAHGPSSSSSTMMSSSHHSSAAVALPLSLLSPSLLSTLDSPSTSSSSTPGASSSLGLSYFPGASSGVTATLPSVMAQSPNKKTGASAVAAAKAKAVAASAAATAAAASAASNAPRINEPVIDQPFARMLVEMSHDGTWLGPTTTMLAQSDTDWKNGLNALVALVLSPTSPLPAPVLYRVAHALLTSLARALKGGLIAAETAAQSADRSQPWDKKIRDGMIRNINRELMTQESLLRPGGLTGTDLAPSLPAHRQLVTRVMGALAALHDANTQARTVPQHIFKSPALNNCFRHVLGAAWRGDPITGALPNGIGEALAAALLLMPPTTATSQPLPSPLLIILDGYTKAMLMHSSLLKTSAAPTHGATDGTETLEGAGAGVRRLGLAVSRDRAGAQAVDIIARERLLPEGSHSEGPLMAILKPYFHANFVAGAAAIKESNMSARDKRTEPVEEGEGHGPRKEFFALVSQQVTSESFDPSLFQYRRSCEGVWFHPDTRDTLQTRMRYTFFGWLIGACLLHRSQFAIVLPRVFFTLLLRSGAAHLMGKTYTGSKCGLADLGELDPQLLKSALDIKSMDSSSFRSFLEAQGVEKPGTVTQASYVADMAHRFLVEDIKWQMACVWRGFSSSLGPLGLELLRKMAIDAVDLADLVCGPSAAKQADDFDVQHLFRLVTDGDVAEYPQLIKALWQVIATWPVNKKRLFLRFVTGIDKLPAPLTEELVLELPFFPLNMDDHRKMLMTLPQSHTCTNTLEMPNYWESIKALHGAGVLDLSDSKQSAGARRKVGSETGRSTNSSSNGGISGRTNDNDDDDDADSMDARLMAKLRAVIDDRLTLAIENTDGYGLDSGVTSASFSTSALIPSAYANGVGRLGTTVITPNMPAVTRFGSPARFSATIAGTSTNGNNSNATQPSFGSLHGLRTNVSNSGPSSTIATPGRSGLHTPISGRPNFMPSSAGGTRPTSGSPIDDVDEDEDVALMAA